LLKVYKVVRSVVPAWDKDRYMSPDIAAVSRLLKDEKIWVAVKHHIEHYHAKQDVETRVFSPSTFTLEGPRPDATGRKRKISVRLDSGKATAAKNAKGPMNGGAAQ
jgi:histidine ammonia-lyase